jgi:MtrB/PioB family decaheme-associated outer membrane protein
MRTTAAVGLLFAVVAVLCLADSAFAQIPLGGLRLEGDVEAGLRFFIDEPSENRKAKFEEYRDFPNGAFLERLRLRLFRPDESYSADFGGSKWGQEDQEFFLGAGRLGLWHFGFEWDQTPHVYSTTARFLATQPSPGVFTLPTPRPALSAHNTAEQLDEVAVRWDTARLSFVLTPTPDLEFKAQYSRIAKDGERPYGMSFGSPGANFYEILEPMDHRIHDVRFQGTLARERWQLQFGYAFSLFENALHRVRADNPCFGVAECGGDAAGPATGQTSLAPDNMAHTFSIGGGVNLPMRTRVNTNLAYSLRFQDDSFLPHTINTAISSPGLALPQGNLDGMVGTLLLNVYASSRPLRPLTLSFKYRLYDFNDMSDTPLFPAHVVNDRTLVVEDRQAGRFEYTRHNAELDARWRFAAPVALTVGGGWERWDRNEHREVPESDEYFAKAAADLTPFDWFLARLTYRPSFRRIDTYNTLAHLQHTVVEEDPVGEAQSQSPLLRKYDEGERDRQRLDLLLQFTPTDAVSTTISASWYNDDYIKSTLGLQDATTWSAGFDVNWTPLERVSIFGGYVHEVIYQKQRSRSRPVTGTTTFDFPDFDWVSVHTDTIDTVHAGVRTTLIPRRLDWNLAVSYAFALGRVDNRNPSPPNSGTAAQNATATVQRFPPFEDELFRLDTALRYHFAKVWTLALGYAFESFRKNDWRTEGLNPFTPGVTSIYLGNDLRNYAAHIVAVTLGYRFK